MQQHEANMQLKDLNKKSLIRLCQNYNAKQISELFELEISTVMDIYKSNGVESYLFRKSVKSCKFERAKEICKNLGYEDALECSRLEGRWFFLKYITPLL